MPAVAILGAGAVGGLLAGALTRAGVDCTLLARPQTAAAIARDGLAVDSPRFGVFTARPAVCDSGACPFFRTGALVVAVKAPALEGALAGLDVEPDVVVPLLNGVEHMAALRERFGERAVAGVVRVQAHREGPARIVHRAPFVTVTVAEPGAPALEAALRGAGVDVERGGTEAGVLWGKLSRLAALALATTAADAPLGDVREDARAAALDVAAVARAEGAEIDGATVVAELDALPDAASSSLRGDVAGGAEHELDAIGGAVLRAAARHGLEAPAVTRLVRAVELRLSDR
jgi:2-dehydropantoate 2-reductase